MRKRPDHAGRIRILCQSVIAAQLLILTGKARFPAMNKDELIERVAARSYLTRAEAFRAVEAVFATIGDAAVRGEAVSINRFGIFSVKSCSAREGRNPRTGERILICPTRKLVFRSSRAMKDLLLGEERSDPVKLDPR